MIVFTDSPLFADSLLGNKRQWQHCSEFHQASGPENLAWRLLRSGPSYRAEVRSENFWDYCYLVKEAARSQFDVLAEGLDISPRLPNGILCCADSGEGFHGQHDRPWVTSPGNLHLSALFRPDRRLPNCGIGFTVVSVVTVLQVLESVGIGQARVKWVNDILVGRAKVGGVLVHIKTQGDTVTSALVGIGLNVEKCPTVAPTPFVTEVAALKSFMENGQILNRGSVFRKLAATLAANYTQFLDGGFLQLLEDYRQKSVILGRRVSIYEDKAGDVFTKIASGKVASIGNNLELRLEETERAVWRGRLILED